MTIAEFLKAPYNYQIGLKLLLDNNPESTQIERLKRGYTIINEKLLIKELKALVNETSKLSAPPNKLTAPPQSRKVVQKIKPTISEEEKKVRNIKKAKHHLQKTIDDLKIKKTKLLQEASYNHHQLSTLKNQKERYKRASVIVDNWNEIEQCWKDLDYIYEYNKLPIHLREPDKFEVGAALIKKRNNLRSYVTKYKKQIAALKDEKTILKYQDKLRDYEFELKCIEKELK